ncbi:DNA recombination protein RmuC [Patescibacteria group bacterium]|nr:DNA recombination protein RmuC [Patescibacteria group bacterium]
MEITVLLVIIAILILLIAVLMYRLIGDRSGPERLQAAIQQLQQQQGQQLQQTTSLVLQQMTRQQEAQDRSSQMVHTRLDHATKVVADVQGKLMQLEEANKRIFDLGKDISSLQRILQAPKLRGGMGEIWLAELIAQIIPAGHFKMQYGFKSGEVCDAVIFLRDGLLLPIDSKFSLENFVRMVEAEEDQKAPFKRQFMQDMKKRIDEIAKKYILPGEGTLDFAFMYVPAENVYYQAFIQDEDDLHLLSYAFGKQVIPVSPSSFYAYLQVIFFGLRGLEIEKSAKEIQKNLTGLQGEFGRFREQYEKIGVHLRHAAQSYDQSDKRLGQVEQKFMRITSVEQTLLEEEPAAPLLVDEN